MLSKLTSRIRAAIVTSLAVLALGLGVAAPAAHAQMPCAFGVLYPWPVHGTTVNVKINKEVKTIRCNNSHWQTFVKPTTPATPPLPPVQPPRPR
jgi:hypothetical protein